MKLKITAVRDIRNIDSERVVMEATEDCDLGDYILFDTTYTEKGGVSNEWRHIFIFPNKKVKKGEIVRVYTKKGSTGEIPAKGDTPHHYNFYWNLEKSIWNDNGDCAHLYEIKEKGKPFIVPKATK